jgi:nucleotide-binding universal stress UspA family protein
MGINVLLCTDGSDLSIQALRDALPVLAAADRCALLTVESIVDPNFQTGNGFTLRADTPGGDEQIETSGDREAKRILDLTVAALGLDDVDLLARAGTPGETICDVAVSMSADVIVIGTHGRSGFRRAVTGSTSDHVVRHARCPVLVQGAGSSER